MKRSALAGALAAGAAMLAIPFSALAQLPPSPPVALFYGSVPGASVGQGVVAIVVSGNQGITCGATRIIDSGGPVFAVDIISNSQIPGCGASGRTVQFYIPPTNATQPGRMAVETATIPSTFSAVQRNLTPGASLTVKRIGVQVSSDGIPGN